MKRAARRAARSLTSPDHAETGRDAKGARATANELMPGRWLAAATAAFMAGGALTLPLTSHATTPRLSGAYPTTTITTTSTTTPATTTTTAKRPAPPLPPLVYTGIALQVASSSATLKGLINPRGQSTQYHFEYGQTTAYALRTPSLSAGAGTVNFSASVAITGLTPATVYHYRLVASGAGGDVFGADRTFRTASAPRSLTLATAPNPVTYGRAVHITGTLTGAGGSPSEVILELNHFPFTEGFHTAGAPESPGPTGTYSFELPALQKATQIRVESPGKPTVVSSTITEQVAVHVVARIERLHRHGYVRIFGSVTPRERGATVAFERLNRRHHYTLVGGTALRTGRRARSHFSRTIRLPGPGQYRVLVHVAAGSAQTSGYSQPIGVR